MKHTIQYSTMNDFSQLDAQSIESRLAQVTTEELSEQANPLDSDTESLRDILLDDIQADIEYQANIDRIACDAWLNSIGY